MLSFLAGGEPKLTSEGICSVYDMVMAEYFVCFMCQSAFVFTVTGTRSWPSA